MIRICRWMSCSLLITASLLASLASTASDAPWGRASASIDQYKAQKVVYDVGAAGLDDFSFVLDRASHLKNLYQANPIDSSIVLVMHGAEVRFFDIDQYAQYADLMARAHSLSIDGIVEFRMCGQAAKAHGLEATDIHGFVSVVPMADAEIVRLQQEEGYVYMQ